MDFTNYERIFSESLETKQNTTVVKELQKSVSTVSKEEDMKDRMNLAKANKDLIDLCIATKSENYLSREQLFCYGVLALNTAAIETVDKEDFRIFARRRIELTLNQAIAEAYLINEVQEMVCDNDKIGMEFDSIGKTYCYN